MRMPVLTFLPLTVSPALKANASHLGYRHPQRETSPPTSDPGAETLLIYDTKAVVKDCTYGHITDRLAQSKQRL